MLPERRVPHGRGNRCLAACAPPRSGAGAPGMSDLGWKPSADVGVFPDGSAHPLKVPWISGFVQACPGNGGVGAAALTRLLAICMQKLQPIEASQGDLRAACGFAAKKE